MRPIRIAIFYREMPEGLTGLVDSDIRFALIKDGGYPVDGVVVPRATLSIEQVGRPQDKELSILVFKYLDALLREHKIVSYKVR
jgi:hypothetical protein